MEEFQIRSSKVKHSSILSKALFTRVNEDRA